VVDSPKTKYKLLDGEQKQVRRSDLTPLIYGFSNVYTKGPLVLNSLRYVFNLGKGNDEAFWEMLRDFLQENAYQRVTTEDFMKTAERHFGSSLQWFWDQWLFDSTIPEVRWSYDVSRSGSQWIVTVDAQQENAEFVLVLPMVVHFGKDRKVERPMAIRGREPSRLQLKVPEEPLKITLNEDFRGIVRLLK
jgi:aminopeptidase N